MYCVDRLVKTLGNDFPAPALVWVWISCTHSCLNCLSCCVKMVYKQEIHTHTPVVAGKSHIIIMGVKMLKMAIFFKLIVEIKKKMYISYVNMYIASKWPQN